MNLLFNLNYWAILYLIPVCLVLAILEKCIRALILAIVGILHIPHLDIKFPAKPYYPTGEVGMDEDSKYDLVLAESDLTSGINSDWKQRLDWYESLSDEDYQELAEHPEKLTEWRRKRGAWW